MATVFYLGRGSTFSIALASSQAAATPVKQIQQVSYSGGKTNFDDITNLDSPSPAGTTGLFTEVVPTTNESGQCQISGVFNDADPGQQMFIAAYNNQALLNVTMQMAPRSGQTKGFLRAFTAYVQEPPNYSYGTTKAMSFQGSLKVTGAFTDTPGS